MKTKLVVALVAVLMLVEWIVLRRSAPPATTTVPAHSSAVSAPPRLSPRLLRQASMPAADDAAPGNPLARMAAMSGTNGERPTLTAAQIEPYLQANKRNAESLLAALNATSDKAYLKEAKERFPNDPRVALMAASQSESPEERRQWLDRLKQTAPDNSLGNYLSAANYFNSGQTNLAVQELMAISGKAKLDDYSRNAIQSAEEAWKTAGYSGIEATYAAFNTAGFDTMAKYKQVGNSLTNLVASYRQAGDEASAQAAIQMGMSLGQRLDDPSGSQTLIQTLVGMALENMMYRNMDPGSAYGSSGQTVQNQLDEMARQRVDIRQLVQQSQQLLPTLPEDELANYFNRRKVSGELEAMRWVVNKYGQPKR